MITMVPAVITAALTAPVLTAVRIQAAIPIQTADTAETAPARETVQASAGIQVPGTSTIKAGFPV